MVKETVGKVHGEGGTYLPYPHFPGFGWVIILFCLP